MIITIANARVEALATSTRTKCRNGVGQPIASEVMSIRERIAAPAA